MTLDEILIGHLKYGNTLNILKGQSPFKDCFENIVVAPMWGIDILDIDKKYITKINNLVYNVETDYSRFSFVTVGMMGGANIMDKILELAIFHPRRVIFIGSASSLSLDIDIGDTVVIRKSFCGNGSSRYLNENLEDDFGKSVAPSPRLNEKLMNILKINNIDYHYTDAFSIDTIFTQFNHLDYIKKLGCEILEMETYATFKACHLCGIEVCALINISDSCAKNKSLYSGRTLEEKLIRNKKRKSVVTKVVLELYKNK